MIQNPKNKVDSKLTDLSNVKCALSYYAQYAGTIHTTSARAEMTFPSVVRDLLILAPSCDRARKRMQLINFLNMNLVIMIHSHIQYAVGVNSSP